MEEKHRANRAFTQAKQLGIWTAALVFSYVDLGTTVVVGREYLDMGTAQGTHAARVTFGILGTSLGLQTFFAYLSGSTAFSYSNGTKTKYSTHHSSDSLYAGQGVLAMLATVIGAKPLWDTFFVMAGKRPAGSGWSAEAGLASTRFATVVLDSL